MTKIIDSKPITATSIVLLVFGIVMGIRQIGLLQELELALYDFHLKSKVTENITESPVLLIRIYEPDIQRLGYPINDYALAEALNLLNELGARAIGVDLYRDFPASGHDELRAAVIGNSHVVMIEKRLGESVPRPDFIEDSSQVGFSDLKQDTSGVIRRGLLILWDDAGQPYFSLGLQLVLKYLQDFGITITEDPVDESQIRLGETTLRRFNGNDGGYQNADDGGYQIILDYGRGTAPFPSYSLSELLSGELSAEQIRGRVVILGMTAASMIDRHESPLTTGSGASRSNYGLEIQAHTVDQLIRVALQNDTPLEIVPEWVEILWIMLLCILGAVLGVWIQRPWLLIVFAVGGISLIWTMVQYIFFQNFWLPAVAIALAYLGSLALATICCAQREHAERELIMQLFGKFVAPEVATVLWQQREQFMEEGRPRPQRLTITVMIIDLQGYTSPTENMDPAVAMEWINRYLDTMTCIAAEYGGIVDDYAGDGIKVNFGVPIARQSESEIRQDAQQAVDCALAMGAALSHLNDELSDHELPACRLRIGICSGVAIAGNLGSAQRMKYTTVGDVVNTAARLESFDKKSFKNDQVHDFRILIGELVYHYLGHGYQITSLGECHLCGKNRGISVYRIWGKNSDMNEQKKKVMV
ncbi:MAG: adenylate/guanylate cyclase domain-containing protein [Gammaproteobacteria bacterium]|nr:adenylate/guanylate cyclase domain-containing protein [Gammaproteobacteria bacterium]